MRDCLCFSVDTYHKALFEFHCTQAEGGARPEEAEEGACKHNVTTPIST